MSGGYGIHTALNPRMQAAAEALFEDGARFPADGKDGTPVQAALVALDTENGELQAVIGGRRYDVMRGLNRATDMRRQPGSAFKPVSTYAAAIDAYGYLPSSIVDDTPRAFSGGYSPGQRRRRQLWPVTLREALSRSLNVATVDLADTIGVPPCAPMPSASACPWTPPTPTCPSPWVADLRRIPGQLGAAYCALANGGTAGDAPRHTHDRGSATAACCTARHRIRGRAVSPETAYMVTDMLKTAATKGSAKALSACGLPVAGKTGTVAEGSDGTRDIWTVAYTPDAAVCVWMGFDDPGTGNRLPASEGGSGYPARLCAAYLDSVSSQLSGSDFKRPAGIERPWWTASRWRRTGPYC